MLSGGLLAVAVVAIGVGLTLFTGLSLRFEERLFVGIVVGVVVVCVASFGYFLAGGMGWATIAFGLGVAGALGAYGYSTRGGLLPREAASAWRRLRLPARDRRSLRPFALLTLAAGAVTTRVLALAYQTTPAGLSTGSLAGWGDWAAHLAYSGSFAYGDNRGLELPLAAGSPLRYHFMANYFGSLFAATGLELTRALVISAWLIAIAFAPLMFCAVQRLSGSRLTAALSVLLLTLSGGVGAWYFIEDVREHGWRIISSLPETYARMPDQQLWVDNTISASLYAQRSTLLGMTIGMAALVLVLAARPGWRRGGFVAAGLLVGMTGIAHVHLLFSALALGALAGFADWRRSARRTWGWFLVPAAAVGLPLAAAINPPTSSVRWLVGWMAPGADQAWPWFWFRNVGLFLPAFLAITAFGGVPRRLRRLSFPFWLWFVVPNLVAFHPSEWNNTKFFLFWQWAGCVVIAAAVARLARPLAHRRTTSSLAGATAGLVAVATMTATGGLDTVRAMQRSTAIPWVADHEVAAAHWLRDNARRGDRLVYGATNTSAVAALSGVPALSGYPGWTDDLGLPDWNTRWAASRAILSGVPDAEALAALYGITYVVIGPRERAESDADDGYWAAHGTLLFERGDYRIYRVGRDA